MRHGLPTTRCPRCRARVPKDAAGNPHPHYPCATPSWEPLTQVFKPDGPGDKKKLERQVAADLHAVGLRNMKPQHRFHPTRRWRFDFADERRKIALEIHGGTYQHFQGHHAGAHSWGPTQRKDFEKWSEAAILGWTIIHVDSKDVSKRLHIDRVERALRRISQGRRRP